MGAPYDQSQGIAYSSTTKIVTDGKSPAFRADHEKPCTKCKKYIGQELSGICMACERIKAKPFFAEAR